MKSQVLVVHRKLRYKDIKYFAYPAGSLVPILMLSPAKVL